MAQQLFQIYDKGTKPFSIHTTVEHEQLKSLRDNIGRLFLFTGFSFNESGEGVLQFHPIRVAYRRLAARSSRVIHNGPRPTMIHERT